MNNIHDCVGAFTSLLDTAYILVLGRKGVMVSLKIVFDKKDCFHLMGLQYLEDRPELKRDRGKVFDEIRIQKITSKQIESSDHYYKIKDRIDSLPLLESLFDSNDTIFKYKQKLHSFSLIQADYLMKSRMDHQNFFVFLAKNKQGNYFCRSFFPEKLRDYSKNQATWTLLQKRKIKISTNEETVLYDKQKSGKIV